MVINYNLKNILYYLKRVRQSHVRTILVIIIIVIILQIF